MPLQQPQLAAYTVEYFSERAMGIALADLLPLIVGAAVLPAWIVVVLSLLREGGVRVATAFLAGVSVIG